MTVTHMIALDDPARADDPAAEEARPSLSHQRSRGSLNSPYGPSQVRKRQATTFVLTTSDGRGYLARWSPPVQDLGGEDSEEHPGHHSAATSTASLWSPSGTGASHTNSFTADQSRWTWSGVCFHPAVPDAAAPEDHGDLQERSLERGKGASAADVNPAMDLVAIGCEESVGFALHCARLAL